MKFNILTILSLLFASLSFGQTPGRDVVYNICNYDSPIYKARNSIALKPGFEYKPKNNSSQLVAKIDESLVLTADYSSSQINISRKLNTDYEVGTTNGSFNVSQTGAATFTVPIKLPEGVNGMQPNLAFSYNSQGTDGVLGWGWSLSGMSAITRGPSKIYSDKIIDPVDFDDQDRFYLDGQMLISAQGEYGETGSKYKLENDPNVLIIAEQGGGSNAKIEQFIIHKPDGSKLYYGWDNNSNNSKETIIKGGIRYYLSRIEDALGNAVEYRYRRDKEGHSTYLDKILYKTGTASTIVDFIYDTRFDKKELYYCGYQRNSSYLLVGVKVKLENSLLHEYELKYYQGTFSSHLKEVIEYDGFGNRYNSLAFKWQESSTKAVNPINGHPFNGILFDVSEIDLLDVPTAPFGPFSNRAFSNSTVGDIDNNGQMDILLKDPETKKWKLILNFNAYGTVPIELEGVDKFTESIISDFNGDGKNEILFSKGNHDSPYKGYYQGTTYNSISGINNNQSVSLYQWNLNKLELISESSLAGINSSNGYMFYGDFTGDRKTDLLFVHLLSSGEFHLYIYKWNSEKKFNNISSLATIKGGSVQIADFNGDGVSDFMISNSKDQRVYQYAKNGIEPILTSGIEVSSPLIPSDINGDGITDIIADSDGGRIPYLSTGMEFIPLEYYEPNGDSDGSYANLNNDLEVDNFQVKKSGSTKYIVNRNYSPFNIEKGPSTETELMGSNLSTNFINNCYKEMEIPGDFNGDGETDLAVIFKARVKYRGENDQMVWSSFSNLLSMLSTLNLTIGEEYNLRFAVFHIKSGKQQMHITQILDGLNNTTSINYKKNKSYSIQHEDFPIDAFDGLQEIYIPRTKMEVVSSYTTPNGLNETTTTTLAYENPRVHRFGYGFLGFKNITKTNSSTQITTTNEYGYQITDESGNKHIYPYLKNAQTKYNGKTISSVDNIWKCISNGKIKLPYQYSTTKTDELTGLSNTSTQAYQEVDDIILGGTHRWVVPKSTITVHGNNESSETNEITEYGYTALGNLDFLILKKEEKSTYAIKGVTPKLTSLTNYDYYGNLPLVKEITNNKGSKYESKSTYERDLSTGNIIREGITAKNYNDEKESRFTTKEYGKYKRFVIKESADNNKAFASTYSYDHIRGVLKSETDPNNLTTMYSYGAFNKMTKVTPPEGFYTTNETQWVEDEDEDAPKLAVLKKTKAESSGNFATIYYDCIGRELRSVTNGFSANIYSDTKYNSKGQVTGKSMPYYKGTPDSDIEWATTEYYDADGRVKSVTNPGGNEISYAYTGASVSKTQDGITVTTTYNAAGDVISANHGGNTIGFEKTISQIDGQNVLVETTTNADGGIVTTHTDLLGRKVYLDDPDAGSFKYSYSGFNELVSQTKPDEKLIKYTYDNLGRQLTETWYKQGGDTEIESTVTKYDPVNAIGSVESVSNANNSVYYTYDRYARPQTINEVEENDKVEFLKSISYDAYGRIDREQYGSGDNAFSIRNEYTNGYLAKIKDGDGTSTYWEATKYDAKDRLISKRYNNNSEITSTYENNMPQNLAIKHNGTKIIDYTYSWDMPNMRLKSKTDYCLPTSGGMARTINEVYGYDNMNRLESCTVDGQTLFNIGYNSKNGAIETHSNVGEYSYTDSEHLHAISMISSSSLISEKPNIGYTPFDKVEYIEQTGGKTLHISYGVGEQRIKSVYSLNGSEQWNKYYFHGNVEIKKLNNGSTETDIYLSAPGGRWALIERDNSGAYTLSYLHTDYLGTIIARSTGTEHEVYSYDAWGRRRNATTLLYASAPTSISFGRGYTGHEHLDEFDFINMNGRMYDPLLCRFLSPDNFVQDPYNVDNYNRYAYCLNNPLVYTDPSGELAWFVPVIIGAVVGFEAGGWISSGTPAPWKWEGNDWKAAGVGAIAGAGLGLGVSAGLSAAGANITGIYASQYGATTLAWDITANALMTANINMASSALQGRDLDGVFKSGLVGLAAGGIGGGLGGLSEGSSIHFMSQEGIRRTNYITAGLNGFGDRFVNSLDNGDDVGQALTNGLFGMAEGLYLAHYWGNKSSITGLNGFHYQYNSVKGLAGRYVSSALTQAGTSVPGFGLSVAAWHGSFAWYKHAWVNGVFNPEQKWYQTMYGVGSVMGNEFGLIAPLMIDRYFYDFYTNAIVSPFPFND